MIVVRLPEQTPVDTLKQIKLIATRFPGETALEIVTANPGAGQSDLRLTLGHRWRYDASPACLAALGEFGTVEEPEC